MRCKTVQASREAGFTLVELLTVMSIISILLSILLPSLSGARNQSRITKCRANLRELAAATLRYASQNDDFFPVAADCSTGSCVFWNGHQYFGWNGRRKNPVGNVWIRPINSELGLEPAPPNSGGARIAECPSDAGAEGETGKTDPLFEVLGTSYAMNPILCQGQFDDWRYRDTGVTSSQVLQGSRKVLAFDHIAFGLTFDEYWTAIRPGWHDKTRPAAVVAFIDGHVEYPKGPCALWEWQWYPEASGPDFPRNLTQKIHWTVLPGCD